jgi:hypothetical protein
VAKDQAAGVAGSARTAGQHVAGVAKDEAGNVATEATRQARDILGQARTEISQQAADQQQRVVGGLRSLGTQFGAMAERSDESGVATDLAQQASAKASELADWLEQHEPGSLLEEVKTFARRRPGTFLALAVGAGLVAGRLTRGLKDESSSSSEPGTAGGGSVPGRSTPAYPVADGYPPAGGYASPAPQPVAVVEVVAEPVAPTVPVSDGEQRYGEFDSPLSEGYRP